MPKLRVLLNTVDITEDVVACRDVNASADYPIVSQYRIREATLNLVDPDGIYALRNRNTRAPIGASIRIEVDNQPVFTGEVIENSQSVKEGDITLICSGASWKIGRDEVTDFGIRRRFRIVQETEQQLRDALEEGQHRADGVYPILPAVLPASKGSTSGYGKALNDALIAVDSLRSDGLLDYHKFIVDSEGVKTEGGAVPNPGAAFPQVVMKSPYRWQNALTMVREILDEFSIANSQLTIYPSEIGDHFASRGRVGYDTIGASGDRYDVPIAWDGFVTDWLIYNSDFYFLISVPHEDNGFYLSQLLKYDVHDDEFTVVHRFAPRTEVWQLANNGDVFYVLQADSRQSPNARLANSQVSILQVNITNGNVSTIANNGSPYPPQLAQCYYSGGGHDIYRAESRSGFAVHNGVLYYRYFNRSTNVGGVARYPTPASVMSYHWDGNENDCGLAFSINSSGRLSGGIEFRDGVDSEVQVFQRTLS